MVAAPPSPLQMDDLIEEVLFRVPPEDPLTLVHAALICKHWRRVIHDSGFCRRFRTFHRAAPILGVLCNSNYATYKAQFIPTCSFRPPHAIMCDTNVVDARHGRVLLHTLSWGSSGQRKPFAVWDPVKDEIQGVAGDAQVSPRGLQHLETALVYTYSSRDGAWSRHVSSQQLDAHFPDTVVPNLLLENSLHFIVFNDNHGAKILKYDLATRDTSMIPTPPRPTDFRGPRSIMLMTTGEGKLGFGSTEEYYWVYLWSRPQQATLEESSDVGWELIRVIELPAVLPASLVGFANNGVNRTLFVKTKWGLCFGPEVL
ncbi:hypothetical protein PR202_gb12073 [Eleusine coracana subsp. coracana]|uniref:F-box domain-containing protein n=1 Tax=Eleusine coracana subsp. coracana TaxID=191504 RepID=A0AAV5EP56_ELECO|nr:hypothetical protein QOZ80_7BG0584590 [Eleusine coracana subsp. coracana]GJN24336.1 hypothetical protein PR202_gb12073 [Eleusine coracana subsp. coracana]